MAAWGEIVVSRNKPQVRIYNWELGVVMPLRATSGAVSEVATAFVLAQYVSQELETKLSTLVTFRRPLEPVSRSPTCVRVSWLIVHAVLADRRALASRLSC